MFFIGLYYWENRILFKISIVQSYINPNFSLNKIVSKKDHYGHV
jgi:hypothetical protein